MVDEELQKWQGCDFCCQTHKNESMAITKQCPVCGKVFRARSSMQKYCSEECAVAAKEERKKRQRDFFHAVEPVIEISQQEYLTFSKAAVLMGCSRQYIYKLVAQGKLPASRLSSRMAMVRKSDIELMLSTCPYQRVLPCSKQKVSSPSKPKTQPQVSSAQPETMEYYSGEEIEAIYKVKHSWLYSAASRYSIPTCRIAGKVYFSKWHVDDHFGTAVDYSTITEWVTKKEVAELYDMDVSAVSAFVHRHHIPSKREFGRTYFSKSHFDELRKMDVLKDDRYCTVDDVQAKYGLSKANILHIVKVKGVTHVKVGVRNLLLIEDVERVMAERAAQGLPVLMK
jgi:excisionase family DNA binding protein